MTKLEELRPHAAVRGILPDSLVTVVSVQWFASEALELTYKSPAGRVANELLYRHDEPRIEIVEQGRPWSEARRLQPHYIESFFHEAFHLLGGSAKQREPRRFEITHVPAPVRNRDRLIGIGEPVLPRYERIAFEKSLVAPQGQPLAAFICPGHPLLDSVIDLTLERHREVEQKAQGYAVAHVVPEHLAEVRGAKLALIARTEAAVKDRLIKEITYWDHRAEELKLQEQAGKPNAKLGEAANLSTIARLSSSPPSVLNP